MRAVFAVISLALSNYIYQWMQVDPNWDQALDRSFFQLVGIWIYVMVWKG